jgi:hypothetical protein
MDTVIHASASTPLWVYIIQMLTVIVALTIALLIPIAVYRVIRWLSDMGK